MAALSNFHQHLLDNLSATQMDNLVGEGKIDTHHRLKSHILRRPEIAEIEEVLFFAEILKCSPYSLLRDFKLGENTLKSRTRAFLITRRVSGDFEQSFEREPVMAT